MSILRKNNKLRRLYSTTPLSAYTEELMNLRWRKMNQCKKKKKLKPFFS